MAVWLGEALSSSRRQPNCTSRFSAPPPIVTLLLQKGALKARGQSLVVVTDHQRFGSLSKVSLFHHNHLSGVTGEQYKVWTACSLKGVGNERVGLSTVG